MLRSVLLSFTLFSALLCTSQSAFAYLSPSQVFPDLEVPRVDPSEYQNASNIELREKIRERQRQRMDAGERQQQDQDTVTAAPTKAPESFYPPGVLPAAEGPTNEKSPYSGTTLYTIVGVSIVIVAIFFLFLMKRRNESTELISP